MASNKHSQDWLDAMRFSMENLLRKPKQANQSRFEYSTYRDKGGRSYGKTASMEPQFLKPGYTIIDQPYNLTENWWDDIFDSIDIEEAVIETKMKQ